MTDYVYQLTQKSKQRAMIAPGNDRNVLAWTDENNRVILSTASSGYGFKDRQTDHKAHGGPSLVINGNGQGGYVFWCSPDSVDGGHQILYADVTYKDYGSGLGMFVASPDSQKVTSAFSSDGTISATLTTQNAQLVINLGWRDPKGHLCLTQIQPWKLLSSGSLNFRLDEKISSCPAMAFISGRPVIAYFDDNRHLNIALAKKNTINFNFKDKFVFKSISSRLSPAIVTQFNNIGYVLWVNDSEGTLNYHQIGVNSLGYVVMSAHEKGGGVVETAFPVAAPSVRLISKERAGELLSQLQIVWSDAKRDRISVAEYEAYIAALT